MNVFNKVTLQSLKKNKTRTTVTIIGIILSAAMICAVTTFTSSFMNYALQNTIYSDGDWHGSELNTEYGTYENVLSSDKVKNAIYLQRLGYAMAEGCQNEYKPYLYLLGASENTWNTWPIHITQGEYPSSTAEILLPDHLSTNGGVTYQIGDTLTLELGNRMLDGYTLDQNNPFYTYVDGEEVPNEEYLQVQETRTYTVSGFYERLSLRLEEYSAPGYTAITLADQNPSTAYLYDVYFKMKKPADVYAYMEDNEMSGPTNTDVLMYSGTSKYDRFSIMLYSLAAIVIGLIMFGSISLIYNAFSISVSERTKQFGLLSSIGATKKQLRRMVFFEAFAVSAIGIPLGILCGVVGIGITLMLIGNKFQAVGFPIDIKLSVSPAALVIAAVVALVTVLFSAWIPSKRATRVSAVEAIRQTTDIHAKSKPIKTSKLAYKLFGLPGMLANKHYKRSKKRYRATIVSLFMSIVLFVSTSAFTDYLLESVSGGFYTNTYDLIFACSEDDFTDISKDELLELIKDDEDVTNVAYSMNSGQLVEIDKSYLSEDALKNLDFLAPQPEDETNYASIYTLLCFVNDNEYKKLLSQYHLDEETYLNPENPLAITFDESISFSDTEQKFIALNLLNSDQCEATLKISDADANTNITIRSGKTLYERPYYLEQHSGLTFVYPESMKSIILSDVDTSSYTYQYLLTSDNHSKSYTAVRQTLIENGFAASNLFDYAEESEANRNLILIIQVFSYGFIVLISLIAAANVFNTISTNISLRRREFAMLKSVGMTAKGFNRMMNFECLLYGSRALLYGLPVSIGITYLIYTAVSEGYSTGFHLPWGAMGIAVLSVFVVVFATMVYSMRKIKKENPIDALKNENL